MRKFNLFNFLEKKVDTAEISATAVKTMEQAACKELALHIGISYIANALSKCEIKTYRNGEENKGLLYYLLNVSPNPNQNASQLINQLVENYFYNNEALIVLHNDKLYCADSFDIDDSAPLKEFKYKNVIVGNQQIKREFKAGEVFHFKLDNKNVKKLIDGLYLQYGEIIELALQTFKTSNSRKYKLLLDGYKAGDPNFARIYEEVIKAQLKTFIENNNAVYPQFKGTELQEFQTSVRSDTGDIIAMRKEVFDTTAQALKIPLPLIYGNMTNLKDIVSQFLTFCIDPLADMISEEMTRKKYSFDEWKRGNYIEVDTSCINYIDILDVADKVDKAISSGVASIDDLRHRLHMKELNTEFSTAHFITKNYELAENMLKNLQDKGVNENETDVLLTGESG